MAALAERFHAARRDRGLAVVEGLHGLKHAVRFGARPQVTVTDDPERVRALARDLAPELEALLGGEIELTVVPTAELTRLVREVPPTGVVALFDRPQATLSAVLANGDPPAPIVVLEDPRRMGNVGACIRVAAAAGAAAVLTIGPRDPWHPNAIRGAAGLHFALPVLAVSTLADLLTELGEQRGLGRRMLVAMDGNPGAELLQPGGLDGDELLIFGTERDGVSAAALAAVDRRLCLPMRAGVTSLNLATAVAATLYRG